MTNEAPTPDAERLVRNLKNVAYAHGQTDSVEYGSDKKYRLAQEKSEEAAGALRAHIATLTLEAQQLKETFERSCADVAYLKAENKRLREAAEWKTDVYPEFEQIVMVEREGGGFWWGQFNLGQWYLKYGDGWIKADDVIVWRELPNSSKAALAQTGESDAQAEIGHIEAENKRLMLLNSRYARQLRASQNAFGQIATNGTWDHLQEFAKTCAASIRAVLAQGENAPSGVSMDCPVCGGRGHSGIYPYPSCIDCNGTGRKGGE